MAYCEVARAFLHDACACAGDGLSFVSRSCEFGSDDFTWVIVNSFASWVVNYVHMLAVFSPYMATETCCRIHVAHVPLPKTKTEVHLRCAKQTVARCVVHHPSLCQRLSHRYLPSRHILSSNSVFRITSGILISLNTMFLRALRPLFMAGKVSGCG